MIIMMSKNNNTILVVLLFYILNIGLRQVPSTRCLGSMQATLLRCLVLKQMKRHGSLADVLLHA